LDQKPGAKIMWKITWPCCMCCNPEKGRVDFEDGWLIKSSFITKDEMKLPIKKYCLTKKMQVIKITKNLCSFAICLII
jgi:hypothetical protein